MRKLFWLFLPILYSINSFAITGDSLHFLTLRDTIVLSIDNYGDKVFYHTLEHGQTLFSLARFYGLRLDDIYYYNPRLKRGYEPGQKVKIQIPNKAIRRFWSPHFANEEWITLLYKVKRGDTFFGIARRHFKLPLDSLYARNNLPPNAALQLGQYLEVGWISINGVPDSLRSQHSNPLWRKSYQLKRRFIGNSYGKKMKNEKGAAYWDRNKKSGNKLYVLHREAKIGSIIAVSNQMYRRTVYAKVIGRISDRAHGTDVKIVVSPTMAKMLGAVDPKFYVSLKYYK